MKNIERNELKLNCIKLHNEIKNKIKGKVYISINTNNIIVHIFGYNHTKFKYVINNIDNIDRNYKYIARKIVNVYKKFILNKIFNRRYDNGKYNKNSRF